MADAFGLLPLRLPWRDRPETRANTNFNGLVAAYAFKGDRAFDVLGNVGDLKPVVLSTPPGHAIITGKGRGTRSDAGAEERISAPIGTWDAVLNGISGVGTFIFGITLRSFNSTGYNRLIDCKNDGAGVTIQIHDGVDTFYHTVNSGKIDRRFDAMIVTPGLPTSIAITNDATSTLTYLNAVLKDTNADTTGFVFGDDSKGMTFGSINTNEDASSSRCNVDFAFVFFFDKFLSQAQIQDIDQM